MGSYANQKPIGLGFALSMALHLLIFILFYYASRQEVMENVPVIVEYVSRSDEPTSPSSMPSGSKKTSEREDQPPVHQVVARPVTIPSKPPVPDTKTAPSLPEPEAKPVTRENDVSREVVPSPPLPGKDELIPSLDKLTGGAKVGEQLKDEDTVSLESTDFKYTSYLYGVKLRIEGVWKYPEAAKRSALQGRGLISFTIGREGQLSDLKLLESSGYPVLDDAIIQAVRSAAPFNPMTENMGVKKLKVVAAFEYNMIRPTLWGR